MRFAGFVGVGLLVWAVACDGRGAEPAPSAKSAGEPQATPTVPKAPTVEKSPAVPTRPSSKPVLEDGARDALATAEVVKVEKGKGGRTLAFKITLEGGVVGYYKPEQTFSGSHWYAEIASHHLDRELGFHRAPLVVGRAFPWARLAPAAGGDRRVEEIVKGPDGTIRGAFVAWIDGDLERLPLGQGWERWVRLEGPLRISPYQRPQEWLDDRNAGHATHPWPTPAGEPDVAGRPAELSDMILFDYLTTNVDRWGGDNTNVRTLGKGGPLLFFDNGAGFTPGEARIPLTDARLHGLQRFRRATVERIRRLDFARLRARMATDPLSPVLTEKQWAHLAERHRHLLEYVEDCVERFGERVFFEAESPEPGPAPQR